MPEKNYVFNTPWFSIEAIPPMLSGEKPYYSIVCPDAVVILAQTCNSEFILVRQFRPPQNKFILELPSGYVDTGESDVDAVQRELIEETGYSCEKIIYLGALKLCPSRIDNTIHTYCGINATLTGKQQDNIEIILLSPSSLEEYIFNGKYNEPTGIAMYFISKEKKVFFCSERKN